jgi:CHAT domain-containing protein/tetratricopeptide (TPR) repeat protein
LLSPDDRHLTEDELATLAGFYAGRQSDAARGTPSGGALVQHLSSCQQCAVRAAEYTAARSRLAVVKSQSMAKRSAECPPDEELRVLAAGSVNQERLDELLAHAIECDYCGTTLRDYMDIFSDVGSSEEEALVAGLASSSRDWQQELAHRLGHQSGGKALTVERNIRDSYVMFAWRRWAIALAGILIVATFGWIEVRPDKEGKARNLIAAAYTEQRTIEMRLPNTRHAPMRVERGKENSHLSRPPSLLEAEALVARNLALHPSDPAWISLKGRIDLLEGNEEAAITSFQRAAAIDPQSAAIKVDLASAYFERAESETRAADYGMALEFLGKALAQDPNNTVALFNRAIVAERMFLYQNALEDWGRYLSLEPTGEWSQEARDRMSVIEKRLKDRSESEPKVLGDTGSYLEWAQTVQPGANHEQNDSLDEIALEVATTEWLNNSDRSGRHIVSEAEAARSLKALQVLAKRLEVRHQDRWLAAMLSASPSRAFHSGVSALAAAVQEDLSGNPVPAVNLARKATELFAASPSEPGWSRARLEEVYALHRSGKGESCAEEALKLPRRMRKNGYAWMEGQAYLELFNCQMLVGDIAGAEQALLEARTLTQKFHYPILELRVAGFEASLATQKGDKVQSWAKSRIGLAEFWTTFYPAVRGYHFYSELGSEEADSGQPHTSIMFMKEAASLIGTSPLRSAEAEERFLLATQARRVGMTDFAQSEFRHSEAIFSTLPQDPATLAYRAEAEIALAQIEGEQGRIASATDRLRSVRSSLSGLSTFSVLLGFYGTSGRIAMLNGDTTAADHNLRTAMVIAESGLASLSSETDGLTWDHQTRQIYRDLVRLEWNQGHFESALDLWEWYRGSPLRIAKRGATDRISLDAAKLDAGLAGPTIPQVNSRFQNFKDRTVISYAFLEDGIAIWRFDEKGLQGIFERVNPSEIKQVAARFSSECGNVNSDYQLVKQDGARLYNWLLAPIIANVDLRRTIVIEPDGLLNLLPFGALIDPSGEFFGVRYPIEISLGVAYASLARPTRRFTPDLRALIVSSPAVIPQPAFGLSPLPDALREANAIAARFPRNVRASGQTATREFVEREMGGAQIFHFAGHSLVRADHLFLVLAAAANSLTVTGSGDSSLLDAERLRRNLCQKCALAVFSACSSATGGDGSLFDPSSIPRAVLTSGVPNVVASLWDVDSSTTADYMDKFYESLLATNSVPKATQKAAATIRARKNTSHPYFWAAFVSYGTASSFEINNHEEERYAIN